MVSILVKILTTLILAALIVGIGLNIAPFINESSCFGQLLHITDWTPSKPFQHISTVVFSAGALLALLTYTREREKLHDERARLHSEQLLKQATAGLDEVLELLRNRNNNRIIWVRAARSLLQARALGAKIEVNELQQAYRLYEHRIRNELYMILTLEDSETGNRLALPPQFFYGISDWVKFRTLDEIAVEVSSPIEAYSITIDKVPPEPHLPPLAEKSVVAIFDFLDYPGEYEDLLQEVEIWEENWSDVHHEKAGAARYIAHRSQKYAINGKLYDRTQNEEATNNTMQRIDEDDGR